MIMNKKISVIVPMYNSEKSIERCVDSILNQTYCNLEVILVNDGSKDKTEEICNNLAKKDNRIKYFYKKNSGVSETRNYGLDKVQGDFISFVDSDDYIEKDMYETMLKKIDDAEIIICEYFYVIDNKKVKIDTGIKENTFEKLDEFILSVNDQKISRYINTPWNKLIKSELINNNNIRFNSKISLGEDLVFNLQYMKLAKKIKIINEELYNFNISNEGLGLKKRNIKEYMDNSINFINELIYFSTNINNLGNILLNELCNIINRLINEYEKKYVFKLLKSLQYEKVHNFNYKVLTKKNYLIHLLLKYKKYKIIVFLYVMKNKIKKRRN